MGKDWKALKQEIEAAAHEGLNDCPPDILRVFEYEILTTNAGTGGLMMGPWYEGATACRYLGPYYVYNTIKLAKDSNLSVEKIRRLLGLFMSKALGTVRLCGMEQFADFARRTLECVNEMENRDDVLCLLNALSLYGSCVNAWQNYRVKWGLGFAYRIPTREELLDRGARALESYQ